MTLARAKIHSYGAIFHRGHDFSDPALVGRALDGERFSPSKNGLPLSGGQRNLSEGKHLVKRYSTILKTDA